MTGSARLGVKTFQSGSNTWHTYANGRRPEQADKIIFAVRWRIDVRTAERRVSRTANMSPIRQIRCPIGRGRSRRPIRVAIGATWEADDQRFVDHRPDVLTYVSAPLEKDLVVTGKVEADLYASTSGTDSDFVVKVIDVFPEDAQSAAWKADDGPAPGQYAKSLNGYQLPIAMEVRRGRYLKSFEKPEPLQSGVPVAMEHPASRPRSRVPKGTSHYGAGPVHLVPVD